MVDEPDDDHVRAMGALFPLAVHALSQPASVLGGYLDLLAVGVVEVNQDRALERLQQASTRIGDILQLLRKAQVSAEAAAEVKATLSEYRSSARIDGVSG